MLPAPKPFLESEEGAPVGAEVDDFGLIAVSVVVVGGTVVVTMLGLISGMVDDREANAVSMLRSALPRAADLVKAVIALMIVLASAESGMKTL